MELHIGLVFQEKIIMNMMLYDKLKKQSKFIELLAAKGKTENIRDYMVKNIKSY